MLSSHFLTLVSPGARPGPIPRANALVERLQFLEEVVLTRLPQGAEPRPEEESPSGEEEETLLRGLYNPDLPSEPARLPR